MASMHMDQSVMSTGTKMMPMYSAIVVLVRVLVSNNKGLYMAVQFIFVAFIMA